MKTHRIHVTLEKAIEWKIQTADEVLGKRKLVPKKPLKTNEILALIAERNKLRKIGDHIGYKIIKNQITDKC